MTPEQLGNLVDAHAAALTLYARQWCATPGDIVQQAFVKLMTQRTEPDRVLPWLYRVVRNGALDAARAERRRRKYEGEAATRAPVWFAPTDEARIDGETATVALQGLSAEQREIVVARLWGG